MKDALFSFILTSRPETWAAVEGLDNYVTLNIMRYLPTCIVRIHKHVSSHKAYMVKDNFIVGPLLDPTNKVLISYSHYVREVL